MDWLRSDFTVSGYALLTIAPADGIETSCTRKESMELAFQEYPDDNTWTHESFITQDGNIVAGNRTPMYFDLGYVEEGYIEGNTIKSIVYVEEGYSESGYFEADYGSLWIRWVSDPVVNPYTRDGYFTEEANKVPCVPYTLEPDIYDDLYGKFPYGDVVPAVLINDQISSMFGLKETVEKRRAIGEAAFGQGRI